MKKFFYFAFVGGIGFIIDSGLLSILVKIYSFNIYLSRLFSFLTAVLLTWILNRKLVFNMFIDLSISKAVEYRRYFFVQVIGALCNLFIFTFLVESYPFMKDVPIIPLSIGAFFGLLINFTGARFLVFSKLSSKGLHD